MANKPAKIELVNGITYVSQDQGNGDVRNRMYINGADLMLVSNELGIEDQLVIKPSGGSVSDFTLKFPDDFDDTFGQSSLDDLIRYFANNNFFFRGNVNDISNVTFRTRYYEIVSSASGQITIPTGATIQLDQFQEARDALLTEVDSIGQKPIPETPVNSSNELLTATLDASGNYQVVLSSDYSTPSTPTSSEYAIIYYLTIPLADFGNLDLNRIADFGFNVDSSAAGQNTWVQFNENGKFGAIGRLRVEDGILIADFTENEPIPANAPSNLTLFNKGTAIFENAGQGETHLAFVNQQAAAGEPLGIAGTSEGIGIVIIDDTDWEEFSGLGLIYFYSRLNDPSIDIGVGSARFARFSRTYAPRDVSTGIGTEDLDKQPVFTVIKSDSNSPYIQSWGEYDDNTTTTTEFVYIHKDGYLIQNNFSEQQVLSSDPSDPPINYYRTYSIGQEVFAKFDDGTIKNLTTASVNIFTPTGGDDTTAFEAYVADQIANLQPAIYLANPTGAPIQLSNLTNSEDYNLLPWIGVYSPNGATEVQFSGSNTILLSGGCKNLEFKLAASSSLTLQGFSEHSLYELAQVTFENGVTNSTLTFQACTCLISGRVDIQSGATGNIIHISDRSTVNAQNWDNNNGTSFTYISGDANLTVNRGDGVVNVGQQPNSTVTDRCRFTFNQWDAANPINVYGSNNTITGNGASIVLTNGSSENAILGINGVTDNSGNTTNEFVQQKRQVTLTTSISGYDINNATPTPIQWDTIRDINTNFVTVDLGTDNTIITFKKTTKVRLGYKINQQGDNNRINLSVYATLNGDTLNEMAELTESYTYTRNNASNQGTNQSYVPIEMNVTINDQLQVFGIENGETGFAQVLDGWVFVEEILY